MLFPHGKLLVCNPQHFDVKYEINPWMNVARTPVAQDTEVQWRTLHHTLLRLGAWLEYIQPLSSAPDMVFTANGGLIRGKKCVVSRFRHPQRQMEAPAFRAWFEAHGYEVIEAPGGCFEGEGDALFAGDTLFCGAGFRSDAVTYTKIAAYLGAVRTVSCALVDPRFYHLDTCFCPLSDSDAIYFPPAFSAASREVMKRQINLHEVPEEEAKRFACNAVVLGKSVVLPAGCPRVMALLAKLGYEAFPVKLDEFLKGGGASKCLVLKL